MSQASSGPSRTSDPCVACGHDIAHHDQPDCWECSNDGQVCRLLEDVRLLASSGPSRPLREWDHHDDCDWVSCRNKATGRCCPCWGEPDCTPPEPSGNAGSGDDRG